MQILDKLLRLDALAAISGVTWGGTDPSTTMKRTRLSALAVMILLAATISVIAQPMKPLPGNNIALGKSAAFSWEPNYSLCKGGDETDLTDGKLWQAGGAKGFWGDTGTVGWSFGRKPGALITFDLEKVCAIDTVAFDTPSGAAQVTFPAAVMVYVSDDGKLWHYTADLINEAIPQDKFIRHRFVAKGLETRGRYIGVYIVKGGFYAFVDEIEVMAGDFDPAGVTLKGAGVATDKIEADALERAASAVQKNITLYFIKAARDQKPDDKTLAALDKLQADAVAATKVDKVDYSAGLPYSAVDRKVCQAMGTYYKGKAKSAVTFWRKACQAMGIYDKAKSAVTLWPAQPTLWSHDTSPFARPASEDAVKLHADMMIGEFEPVAFNVSNNTAEPMQVTVRVADLGSWPAASIDKRIATHVVGSGFLFFDDALTPFGDEAVTIPAGMTRQVWLILNSKGVAAGDYTTTVTVKAAGKTRTIPLTATVYPVEMPAQPQYLSSTWGYFTWKPAKGFEKQAAAEMERSYETAYSLHQVYMPWPEVDPQTKKLIRPIKVGFEKFDEMLAYRPYVKMWLLWPGLEFGFMSLNYRQATDMPAIGTPAHNEIFKEWVRQIRDHMKAKGFSNDQWAFYWVDEPGDESFLKYVVPASKMAKEVDPSILIWEDHQISLKMLEAYPAAIDIHCCPLNYYRSNPKILAHTLAEKHPGWQYLCASSKANDPHRYYRLHHLASVELGLDGAGMWVWGDDGGQFNDYDGPYPSYGMVYATDNGPITGKRREAWREGVEDVELFRRLRTLAEKTGDANLKVLHDESVKQAVKPAPNGGNTGTVEELMDLRLKILAWFKSW